MVTKNQKKFIEEAKKTNAQKFYEWLIKVNNKFLSDNARIERACNMINEY